MRLSEAIRLGSMMKPQCFRGFHRDGGSCAIGAAADAIGISTDRWALRAAFPLLAEVNVVCPACGRNQMTLHVGMIPHLNDFHNWTRERIADWVETIEQKEPSLTADNADGRSPQTLEPLTPMEIL